MIKHIKISGFTLAELIIAAGMLAAVCAFALTMLTQAVRQAEQVRVLIYAVHDIQRSHPLSETTPPAYAGRVNLSCELKELKKSFFVQVGMHCQGPRREFDRKKNFLNPEFEWQNQL